MPIDWDDTASDDGDLDLAEADLTPAEAATLARDAGAKTLVLTHMWEEKDVAALMNQAAEVFPGTLMRATPGMEVTWTS